MFTQRGQVFGTVIFIRACRMPNNFLRNHLVKNKFCSVQMVVRSDGKNLARFQSVEHRQEENGVFNCICALHGIFRDRFRWNAQDDEMVSNVSAVGSQRPIEMRSKSARRDNEIGRVLPVQLGSQLTAFLSNGGKLSRIAIGTAKNNDSALNRQDVALWS